MMSVADSDNLQHLLANLNLDMSSGISNDKKVEKLILQLGELSARYSDLASRYLKLFNSKVHEPAKSTFQEVFENHHLPQINGLQKSLLDTLAEYSTEVSDCLAPSQFNSSTGKFTGDLGKAFRLIIQNLKSKKSENCSLNEVIKSLEQKIDSLELIVKQMDTEKTKLAEVRVRNEFFSEFEGLIKEDLKKTHILQQRITESLVLIKNSQTTGDTSHMDAIFDSLLTELNLQEHLKKMIEKMNTRRLKQDQEIDSLCDKLAAMENTVLQCENDKMLYANQKRLFENEKQELQDKIQKLSNQIKDEQEQAQKLQIEIEHKKNAYSALNKAYEMNKNTLEQMKGKDSMVKRHVHIQDSDISKLKQKLSDQEKQIRTLRDEIQQKTQAIIALSSDKDKLSEQARSSISYSAQVEESNRKIQILSTTYEQELSKLQGLLRSKQEEKDQIVASYSKLIKSFEGIKKDFSVTKSENMKFREKLDKIKFQNLPSELKKELEKELELLRSENQRLRSAYEAAEIEKNKWREFSEFDGSKTSAIAAKLAALEAENADLRRSQSSTNSFEINQLTEERRKNKALEVECENLNKKVWELTDQMNRVNDEQYRVAELLRNNWSSQSIRIEDKLGDRTMDSFVTPLNYKSNNLRSEGGSFDQARYTSNSDEASSEHKYFEDENKRLMEIVAQVKSDLRQAASQSPSSSVFSP